ncbi:MAG: iron export ABC transporter permease subunit FetB [Armatimonadia bacterium]|nr:iron export ABC transporter permease subunit FetB [Armatimonadia bacterium]
MQDAASYIQLDWASMTAGAALIVLTIGISFWRGLGEEKDLTIAAIRCTVQLLVMGLVLRYLFDLEEWYLVLPLVLLMIAIASWESYQRVKKPVRGTLWVIGVCVFIATGLSVSYLTQVVIRVETWYDPQYLIPLAGMILGQAVNGAAISAERLTGAIRDNVGDIEAYLAMGAPPRRACRKHLRDAVHAGLIPTVSAMMVAGIVKLPGMMTGQILAGADPFDATLYQIVIYFALTFMAGITAMMVVEILYRRFFVGDIRLRREAL